MNTIEKIYELAIRLRCQDRGVGGVQFRRELAYYIETAKSINERGCIDRALVWLRKLKY